MGLGENLFWTCAIVMVILLLRCTIRCLCFGKRNNARSAAPGSSTRSAARRPSEVRRTTVYTITSDPRGNDPANDFTDFFWDGLPHGSSSRNEPAKDDKDLPTYEEVMEMTRQAVGSTTTTPASNHTTTTTSVVTPVPASTV